MKAPRACLQCRSSKRKCTRLGPGEPCNACQQRRIECSADLRRQNPVGVNSEPNPEPVVVLSEEEQPRNEPVRHHHPTLDPFQIPWEITVELVDLYLAKVHDRPHSIFHPATLRAQVRNGTVGKALLYAVCALGVKFSSYPDRRDLEARLTGEAKRLLQADLENVCLENMQTCILIATLSAGNCEPSSEALFVRIATSMAEIMSLDSSPAMNGSLITRETVRRVWCSLYVADRWCSSGLGLPRHMDEYSKPYGLPIDEITFQSLPPDTSNDSEAPPPTVHLEPTILKLGLWAHMVSLVRFFGPIQDLNRQAARGCTDTVELDQEVQDLGGQLEAWNKMLLAETQMTVPNLHSHQQSGRGGLFIALHLAYHHYSTLLYFRFLEDDQTHTQSHHRTQAPSSKPSSHNSRTYIRRCKHHASSFSNLLHLARQIKGCENNYPTIGHMTTVSSSVLLHTLLLGDPTELEGARAALNANFEVLIEQQQFWPNTKAMINRLMTFQNICLLSTESHKFDGWMVRCILEHSRALGQRELPCVPANVLLDVESESMALKAREWMEQGRYMDFEASTVTSR
ncbi:putative C6 transcription factor [Aspergillus brunneoviolaceus CBS 621.78]|uniref:Uncharacterized protein n=1 Tax=Aspergillus brunneoviolaceus CBS 621.78 TaxID=1450534 RepID=A0ACD1G6W6_9EURO|nr:hypothetical protein BO95DRAFT_390911 [Aspergillus brunneoviolaceus CBS 621.78]RAH44902.1 hypothetical protein BO95DRAFT_390911 [Aspergillus brunneoviolaceus CBS 621.78]